MSQELSAPEGSESLDMGAGGGAALVEYWNVTVFVHGKSFTISAGDATQRIKWLAHVAIARWDEENLQGWKRLGMPTAARAHKKDGNDLDLGATIRDVLQNGDTIYISTSLHPSDTRV